MSDSSTVVTISQRENRVTAVPLRAVNGDLSVLPHTLVV